MQKKVTKERVSTYEENVVICDLCEGEVTPGNIRITLIPSIAQAGGGTWQSNQIDICSVDCLTKNVGAAGLLLNTSVVPELRNKYKDRSKNDALKEFSLSSEAKQYKGSSAIRPRWTDAIP